MKHVGEPIRLTVLRDKKVLLVDLVLQGPALLVPEDQYDVEPTYFVFGGLLFAPLSRDYLKSWGHEWWKSAPNELITIYETQIRTPERQEVIILQKVLADRINQGYHEYENHVVVSVNGVPVTHLRHLVQLVEAEAGSFVTFGLHDGQRITLDTKKARERGPAILEQYNLRFDRSKDLRRTSPKKRAKKG
jgi:hypothetical protein